MLWPMSPAYYHQMAVNLWVSKNIDRRILYYVPPTRATGPLQSLRVTFCMNEVRRKQIYSIEWELRWWFSACHCERNVSLYDALSQNDILLPSAHNNQPLDYPRQSAWWYMLKQTYILYNELGDMSSCTSAMWQYEPRYMHRSQMKIEWYFSTSHNNQPYSNVICEMRDHWWTLEIKFVSIMIMTEHHRSTIYFYQVCRLVDAKVEDWVLSRRQYMVACVPLLHTNMTKILNGKRYEKWIVECKYYINHITYLEMEYRNK